MKNSFVRGAFFLTLLLATAGAGRAQVDRDFRLLFQCDGPSDPRLKSVGALIVERPKAPAKFRQPLLLLRFNDGSKASFSITGAQWLYFPNPLQAGNVVKTTFFGNNMDPLSSLPAIQFELRSDGSFLPLSGAIPSLGITFQTCGVQLTSNYYWTNSSKHLTEGFACPALGKPVGCPGVGVNP